MKRVVVDASVVIAALFKDGTVRDVLLNPEDILFQAPAYLRDECTRHIPDVAARARIPLATVEAILEDLLSAIESVPPGVYAGSMSRARELARGAKALGDEDYIALALATEAPVWTLDRDFRRVASVITLTTKDLSHLGES